ARAAALALALAAGLLPAPALAQESAAPSPDAPPTAAEIVHLAPADAVALDPGGKGEARVTFLVRAPWHVNAHKPNESFLVPTVLTLHATGGVNPGAAAYPKATQAKLSFSDTPLAVYQDAFTVTVPLTVDAGAAPGPHTLAGTLRFQSCNDQVCLPPTS